ncbi:similar to Naumovozyma dairenensis NDAI_0A05580 hypothetical protein [Maudiozyma saulgeensis]|uniref:Uncharacterized protein n=1 Tax=Maudiozyma saulgeensis TaxID=1789683 RepID=A0A1X7R3T6_9SACH|nr:similar to Naumovozyma dairenensis NDAI_0A05580 hypothetical protein [Kazachstania saulgeensis]
MLRKKTRNHRDSSKRQSMFMETMVNSFSLHQDKTENNQTPLDYISDPIPIDTSAVPVRLSSRREISSRSSEARAKMLKRSSMMLDGNIIRDYNLAVKGLSAQHLVNDEQNTTRSDSETSIASNRSATSSLFSNGNSTNLRDLLYEELDTIQLTNNNKNNKSRTGSLQGTKALFMIEDNMRDNGSWLDPQEIGISVSSNESTPELNRLNNNKFSRTVLDFI